MHVQFGALCGDEFESHLRREELANQLIHVLVGTALPKGIRMGNVEVCIKRDSNMHMLGELTTVASREGMNAHHACFER